MKLSVVIVNYNVKHFLEQCLKSVITACEDISSEIFVVDNNSVDGSVAMVKDLFPSVHVIANKENTGFSKANNQAIKRSTGEYVLLLNPDTIVPENCFSKLISFAESKPKLGACGVKMVDGQGTYLPESKRGLPTPEVAFYKMIGLNKLFPKSKKFGKYHLGFLNKDENHKVDILAGAFMLMRKKALDQVGLLDETFFMYGEDIDLSYRITKGGWENYYFAETSIIHYKGESTKKLSVNYVKVFYKAMVIFAEKHYSGQNKKLFTFLINSSIYTRAGVALISNSIKKLWMPALEAILIFSTLYFLKEYWEEHIKYIKSYPREMMTIHLPYYTAVWTVSICSTGSYRHPFDLSKLLKGIGIGVLFILIIYGLLPNHLHFSRGIILFGTLSITAVLFGWRTIIHYIKFKSINLSNQVNTISLLVGSEKKWEEVNNILQSYDRNYQQIGFVNSSDRNHEKWLGDLDQLQEIIKIYEVDEVIFSTDTISTEDTITIMNELGPRINYYTIPAESSFVIGSHSKNDNGLYFGQQIELNLSKREFRTQKRLFDLSWALFSILLSPLFLLFSKSRNWTMNAMNVLLARKTWIGYASDAKNLPKLPKGVYTTASHLALNNSDFHENLDQLYARNYSVMSDLRVLLTK